MNALSIEGLFTALVKYASNLGAASCPSVCLEFALLVGVPVPVFVPVLVEA
jgi:hypothetical protein